MNHTTQIIKHTTADIDVILNVGRTNEGEIDLDIRVYRCGDVIDVGDIVLTQADWDKINTDLERIDVELFICPACGAIVSEDDIINDLKSGGYGMCMCKFGNGHRVLVRYDPYTDDSRVTLNEERLIEIIRNLG